MNIKDIIYGSGQRAKQNAIFLFFLLFCIEGINVCIKKNVLPNVGIEYIYLIGLGVILILLACIRFLIRKIEIIDRLINSKRFDIFISVLFIGSLFYFKNDLSFSRLETILMTIIYLIVLFDVLLLCKIILGIFRRSRIGNLLPDNPIQSAEEDRLSYINLSNQFAENIYNNGSKDNLVFAIETGWGGGKTSFLNLVKTHKTIRGRCETFQFNPRHFDSEVDLLKKFLEEFEKFLSTKYHTGSLNRQLQKLISIVGGSSLDLKILGMNLGFLQNSTDLEDIKKDINESLKLIDAKKIIIIIDDLDRVPMDKVKMIFRIIELCRDFHNTNYVLCYDNDNFNAIDTDLKKTTEITQESTVSFREEEIDNKYILSYIEKIVSVKYRLPLNIESIKNYFIEECEKLYKIEDMDKIKLYVIDPFERMFKLDEYRVRGKYIGNIRQIKRIINTLKMLYKSDIGIDILSQIDLSDLIKIQIIYLHYNKLFEDLVVETEITESHDYQMEGENDNYCKYISTSKQMTAIPRNALNKYLDTLKTNEKILIKNMFVKKGYIGNNTITIWNNLYSLKKVLAIAKHDFETIRSINDTINMNKILGAFIENKNIEVAIDESIKVANNQKSKGILLFLSYFKNYIVSQKTSPKEYSEIVISYILKNFYAYSINGIAACYDNIINILDHSVGQNNNIDNCGFIGDYVYGTGTYEGNGIIDEFMGEDRGILGLYNVLGLKHYASARSYRNYQRGLTGKNDPNMSNAFYEWRISKAIYKSFKETYIDKDINIFQKIFDMPQSKFEVDQSIDSSRNYSLKHLLSYVIYNLTSDKDGVGFFSMDIEGYDKQNGGIKKELNKYFFEKCFIGNEGIKYFIEYIYGFFSLPLRPFDDDNYEEKKKYLYFKYNEGEGNLLDVLEDDLFKKFVSDNREKINEYIVNQTGYYQTFNNIKETYNNLWKMVLDKINI